MDRDADIGHAPTPEQGQWKWLEEVLYKSSCPEDTVGSEAVGAPATRYTR